MKIMVIQGPNLNMLGVREPALYGVMSLEQIHEQMRLAAEQNGAGLDFFQSNFEGELVDKIQECYGAYDGLIINAAALTHTSIAIRDAIASLNIPAVDIHISHLDRREDFRRTNYIAPVCAGSIVGFGPFGYHLALMAIIQLIAQIQNAQKAAAQNDS